MAKGKHATALFEVIHSARKPPNNSPAVKMPVPGSWWKGKSKKIDSIDDLLGSSPDREASDTREAAPPPTRSTPTSTFAAFELPTKRRITASPPPPQYIDHIEPAALDPMPEPPAARSTERAVQVQSGGGELSFRLSYGGAAAAAFVLTLLIAIAYLVGTHNTDAGNGDEDTVASSAATPGGSGMLAAVTPTNVTGAPATPTPSTSIAAPPSTPMVAPAPAAPKHIVRKAGVHYVVIQSYPTADGAQRASEFLAQNGIATSVILDLPGYTLRHWYSVVDARAFEPPKNNPALTDYEDKLERLGDTFAGQNAFNRFEPRIYRWRADADQ